MKRNWTVSSLKLFFVLFVAFSKEISSQTLSTTSEASEFCSAGDAQSGKCQVDGSKPEGDAANGETPSVPKVEVELVVSEKYKNVLNEA